VRSSDIAEVVRSLIAGADPPAPAAQAHEPTEAHSTNTESRQKRPLAVQQQLFTGSSLSGKRRKERPKALYWLDTTPTAPPGAQAASLALGILREAGARCWSDLGPGLERWPESLCLTPEQLALLSEYSGLLGLVRFARPGSGERSVSLSVCPACGLFELTTGDWWRRCKLTRGCQGRPVKAVPAKRVKL